MKKPKVYGYICGIDWQHEIEHGMPEFYHSIEELKKDRLCWQECGIVKVEIKFVKWEEEQNLCGS